MFLRHPIVVILMLCAISSIFPQSRWLKNQLKKLNNKIDIVSTNVEDIKEEIDFENADPNDFKLKVVPNNFVAALPSWGPSFALQFSVFVNEFPPKNEVRQVMQLFSADERFTNSTFGTLIPSIFIGNKKLSISMQLSDDNEDPEILTFTGLVKQKMYDILITQKPSKNGNGTVFTASVKGFRKKQVSFVNTPVVYNTLGVFVCNSQDGQNANADVFDLKLNGNINIERSLEAPSVFGISPSWTPTYAMNLRAAFKSLPNQRGKLSNLVKLVGRAPATGTEDTFVDLYNQDQEERFGDSDSSLPNMNVLQDSADENYYWCFLLKYESGQTLPKTHHECDLTNIAGSAIEPKPSTKFEISFFQANNQVSALVNGKRLTNPTTGQSYVSSIFSKTLKNVKIALGQNLGVETREQSKEPRFLGLIASALVPAVGSLAEIGIKELEKVL